MSQQVIDFFAPKQDALIQQWEDNAPAEEDIAPQIAPKELNDLPS